MSHRNPVADPGWLNTSGVRRPAECSNTASSSTATACTPASILGLSVIASGRRLEKWKDSYLARWQTEEFKSLSVEQQLLYLNSERAKLRTALEANLQLVESNSLAVNAHSYQKRKALQVIDLWLTAKIQELEIEQTKAKNQSPKAAEPKPSDVPTQNQASPTSEPKQAQSSSDPRLFPSSMTGIPSLSRAQSSLPKKVQHVQEASGTFKEASSESSDAQQTNNGNARGGTVMDAMFKLASKPLASKAHNATTTYPSSTAMAPEMNPKAADDVNDTPEDDRYLAKELGFVTVDNDGNLDDEYDHMNESFDGDGSLVQEAPKDNKTTAKGWLGRLTHFGN